ncbi:MAG: flavocytochrome C [Betaproteobacteria bacterium]|nr:MAG: flavocytochrome C [Betaproteobacteria bacterium]RPI48903.1 MAG: flavocytochrome C [Betaproteobacteria bacterium]
MTRRGFVKLVGSAIAVGAAGLSGCAGSASGPSRAKVVVIGGGFGGATAAKYVRLWAPDIEVTLVEPNLNFVSCPFSNRVLGGNLKIEQLTVGYDKLQSVRGVKLLRDRALGVDPRARQVKLASGQSLEYDRLVVAPGVDFIYDQLPGLKDPASRERVLHSWKAGPETLALRRQLESMRDGGVYALCVPRSPYRCPPGPYERACQVAFYFKNHKPRSKVLILDANEDVQSKKGLFMAAWNGPYKGLVEYRPNSELLDVDVRTMTAKLQFEDVKADVLNVVPPNRAGDIARQAGLVTANDRWCEVNWQTMESVAARGVHVVGDATLSAPMMPKSGHMANQHGKLAADAIIAALTGRAINDEPIISNTCYSWISDREVVHVASIHAYDPAQKTLVPVKGAGGLSPGPTVKEGEFAMGWASSIFADALA